MKTSTRTTMSSLDAIREEARARNVALAAAAAQPAPAPEPVAAVPEVRGPLQQCNVRLTPLARERIRANAKACYLTEQELIERWARTLPALTAPAAPMPWER